LAAKESTTFLRTATGLVRPWSSLDGFIYNVLAINPAIVLGFGFVNGLGIAPGGNMWLALVISLVFCTGLAYVEAALISSMPRSGGDYVFQSRIVSGGLGYINVFVFVLIMQTIWLAYPAWWAADHVVAPFLVIFGAISQNQALTNAGVWMRTGDGFMVLGTIIVAWAAIINLAGMVWYRRFQKVAFYIGMVGMVIVIGLLLTTTQAAFQQGYNSFWVNVFGLQPNMYQTIMDTALSKGYSPSPNVGWESMIIVIPLAMTFMFPAWSCYNAGEIKGAGGFRSQIYQVVVAEIVSVIIALALYTGVASMVGDSWYKAVTWLFWTNAASYPLPIAPYFGFLAAMIYTNPLPMLVVFITLQCWFWMWYPNITLAVSRTMLAMAFDRELPARLADVHPRTRAPWIAIVVIMLFGFVFVALFAYTTFSQLILAASLVSILGLAGSALAALIMPWKRKDLYNSSPISKYELGKIPTISIAGAIWLIFTVITVYIFATEPRVFFISGWVAWAYLIGMYVVAALFYFGYKLYRRSQGFKTDLLYKQIPVE
jgi:amino acid transporter